MMGEGIKSILAYLPGLRKTTINKEEETQVSSRQKESSGLAEPGSDVVSTGSKSVFGRALAGISTSTASLLSMVTPRLRSAFQKDLERIQKDQWTSYIDGVDILKLITGRRDPSQFIGEKLIDVDDKNLARSEFDQSKGFFQQLILKINEIRSEVESLDAKSLDDLPALQKDVDSLKYIAAAKSLIRTFDEENPYSKYVPGALVDFESIDKCNFCLPGIPESAIDSIKRDLHTIAESHAKLGKKSFISPGATPKLAKIVSELQITAHQRIRDKVYQELIADQN